MTDHRAKGARALATMLARFNGVVLDGPDYLARLKQFGLSHEQAAEQMEVSPRTSLRYAEQGAPLERVARLTRAEK